MSEPLFSNPPPFILTSPWEGIRADIERSWRADLVWQSGQKGSTTQSSNDDEDEEG
jgi:hypothetical protein